MATKSQIGRRIATLHRYKKIMDEFNKYDCAVIPISKIHKKYIFPKFFISRKTLYVIFNTQIDKELKELEAIL